jgi:AcrR family transcriptional regulator
VALAGELFAERGYAQTSIRDLGRRAAVTSGAIYGHFRNKAELLAEVIDVSTAEQLEAEAIGLPVTTDHVSILTRQALTFERRRRLRALILQGAVAAQTDAETQARLGDEQRTHIDAWIAAYERNRERLRNDPSVDIEAAVLYTWAVELGVGVLESLGVAPTSPEAWADIQNRLARSWRLPPDDLSED